MDLMIPLLIFCFVTLGIVSAYFYLFRPATKTTQRLRDIGQPEGAAAVEGPLSVSAVIERVTTPLNRMLPASPDEMQSLQKKLMYAGFRSPNAVPIYRALQLLALAAFPGLMFLIIQIVQRPMSNSYSFIIFAAVAGFLLPRMTLDHLTAQRQLSIQWGFADALDLLVVTIEAGMEFNSAIVRLSEELRTAHPALCDEFELLNLEMRVGRSRAQALRNLAERTGVEDMRSFCTMMVQSDRFGTSVGRAIRVYAQTLRTKRRQRAEQEAQKAAVKLLMPLALFLFPTLFIIVLGPAFMSLMDMFGGQ